MPYLDVSEFTPDDDDNLPETALNPAESAAVAAPLARPSSAARAAVYEFIPVAATSLALLLLTHLRVVHFFPGTDYYDFGWDHHNYIAMATIPSITDFHCSPFCWRIGTAMLVRLLPFGTVTGFLLVTSAALWLTGVMMYYLAGVFHLSRPLRWAAMLWFFSSPFAVKFCASDFWLCDPLNYLVLVLCIYFAVTGRDLAFLVTLALGAAVKESALFAFPLHYTFNAKRPLDFRQLLRTAVVSLPAAAVLVGIRLAIPALNDDAAYIATLTGPLAAVKPTVISYHYYPMFLEHGLPWFTHPSTADLELLTLRSFGLLVILPVFAARRNLPLLVRFSPHIFFCLFQVCLIEKSNTERLVVLALPEMILMSLLGLHALAHRLRVSAWTFLPLPLLVLAVHLYRDPRNLYPAAPIQKQVMLLTLYLAAAVQLPWVWRLARRVAGRTNADAGGDAARVRRVYSS